jgi:hypothetical protein
MYRIEGSYVVNILIDGNAFDESTNALDVLEIQESALQALPTITLEFLNDGSLVDLNPIVDGSKIKISLEPIQVSEVFAAEVYEFRVFTCDIAQATAGWKFRLQGYLDIPDMLSAKSEAFRGTARDVFSQVASRNQMTLDADPSLDLMTWIRPGVRGHVFLTNVARHAWSDNISAFSFVIRRNKDLVLANLTRRHARKVDWKFLSRLPTASNYESLAADEILYSAEDTVVSNAFGHANFSYGYGRVTGTHEVLTGNHPLITISEVQKTTKFLQVDKGLRQNQKSEFLPIDVGNVHANYNRAYMQNLRLLSFYSSRVKVTTVIPKNVKLLDRVNLELYDNTRQVPSASYAGEYFVDKIVTRVTPLRISRTISLLREGINPLGGGTDLVGG